ncbi:hypothetical protein Fmac_011522 [Flemingia macrophylla]|uniref:PHD finger protein ALFIN-LIKE n=1 Tax=Flemingia macrophylla TaxID=520843 RepID=A0ABD1MMQ0_9FABA
MTSIPLTVKEIFKDYKARRIALIHALTRDADEVYDLCDTEIEEALCLYGLSDKTWQVTLPEEKVPTDFPEPTLGINFGKVGIDRKNWFYLVAIHSDSWLLAVAFLNGCCLNRNQRKRLFNLINGLPTVAEVVAEWKPDDEDNSTVDSSSNSREITEVSDNCLAGFAFQSPKFADKDEDELKATPPLSNLSIIQTEDEDEHNETLCEGSGANYDSDESEGL